MAASAAFLADWARGARKLPRPTKLFSYGFSGVTIVFAVLFAGLFIWQSLPAWREEGLGYLTGKNWFFRTHDFAIGSLLYGTAAVAMIAVGIAAPIGIGAAVFSSEYLPEKWRVGFKIAVELLAGIPSVVYGLLGILFLRNWIYRLLTPFEPLSGDTLLTAGVLLAVMVLPTIMTLADDTLRAVPRMQRVAARGLGLTHSESILTVALPQARSGLLAAVLLGLGRALGETIAVFLVVGRQDNQWPEKLFSLEPIAQAGQTLTSKLGSSEINIAYGDPIHWGAMVGLGLLLLAIVAIVTAIGAALEGRSGA